MTVLHLLSEIKWAVFPWLVRYAPYAAIAAHEPRAARRYWSAIDDGMLVADIGANLGGYSMLASKRAGPRGRVYAFEPEPDNFRRLSRRVAGLHNVVPVGKAIGASSGEATLNVDPFHQRHSLNRSGGRSITVAVTTLDDFVREHSLPGFDVVKLDIEGAELEAIAGMPGVLSGSRRPVVLCEVHPPLSAARLRDALAVHGYRCEALDGQLSAAPLEVPMHVLAVPAPRGAR